MKQTDATQAMDREKELFMATVPEKHRKEVLRTFGIIQAATTGNGIAGLLAIQLAAILLNVCKNVDENTNTCLLCGAEIEEP